jgi:DNA helicase HerA-like ATPase
MIGAPFGQVCDVGPATVTITLTAQENGAIAPARVGDLIAVETDSDALLARIGELFVTRHASGESEIRAQADIVATILLKEAKLSAGASQPSFIGAFARKPSVDVIRAFVEDRREIFENDRGVLKLYLAKTIDNGSVPLEFAPEKVFGRHCAVLGTSGAGKSWTVARLIEECARYRSKCLLIDPTGEYEALENGVFHVHIGEPHRKDVRSVQAALPYRDLTEADLVAIFRPTSGTQIVKLRSALRTLKLLAAEPKLGTEGTFLKAHKSKIAFEAHMESYRAEVEDPLNKFDITKLPLQLELECVDPMRSPVEPSYWGGVNAFDQSACVPLINRINDILSSQDLETIFRQTRQPSIFEAMKHFLKDPQVSILRISLEFLPATHRVREIVANSIGRSVLALGRLGKFKRQPLIVFLDEAHQALNNQLSDMSLEFPLEAYNLIAKEGRKYGLTLCLATQRPRDIPEDVLSQVGTFFVHRLVNDRDRSTIERASGAVRETLLANLPALAPGEAFLLGIDFPNPLRIRIEKPEFPPFSRGPDYQSFWQAIPVG